VEYKNVLADSKNLSQKFNPNNLDLRQLWNELRANNPQLIAAREYYLAAKATVPQIAAPDNPTVGLIWSGMPVGSAFALGTAATNQNNQNAYSFAQPLKFPGKKSLAADIADKQAESLQAQNDNLYLQLGSQLATLYYSTLAAQRQLQVLSDTTLRTEMIKNIAKARYSNHAAAYVEYLNAQVAQSSAESEKFNLERQLAVAYKNINALIGRDPRDKLTLIGDTKAAISKVPSLIELESYAETSHPILKSSTLQLDAAKKGVTLAKAAYLPDFQVIATSYTPRGPLTSNNGAMYYQFEFDIVIPLYFFTKERYGVEQAQRNQAAIESIDVSTKQQIILGVGSAYATYEQAKKYAEFLKGRQVPQADAAYRVAIAQYANNGQGFIDLLTAQTQLRALEIQLALAESNLLQAQAALFASAGKDPIE
jgi:outer membrane protein TolC